MNRMSDRSGPADGAFEWAIPQSFNFAVDVVDRWAEQADGPCLIWEDESGRSKSFSYSDMSLLTKRLAAAFKNTGARKGDRILIVLPRIPEWQIAVVAALRIGAIPIPCIEMLTNRDIAYRMRNSGAKGFICRAEHADRYAEASESAVWRMALGDAPQGWQELGVAIEATDPLATSEEVSAEDPAIMYYTSGSTGYPKGVLHAARGLYAWRMSARYWLDLRPGETIWCTADTGWSKAGTSILFGPWSAGACSFFYDGPFSPPKRLELLSRYRVTVYCAPSTELNRLVEEDIAAFDLSALRRTVSSGEAMNPAVAAKWKRAVGVDVAEAYGQTETLMIALNMTVSAPRHGSMGTSAPGIKLAVVDDDGKCLPPQMEGNIAMRAPSPQLMLGYWQDPERTDACFVDGPDGRWYLTGDLGVQDPDGYFWYRGRTDDVINSAGYRIGPLEVENALMEHQAVLECAVVGTPDVDRGEVVTAFVVLRKGFSGSAEQKRVLQDHVKKVTAPYKYPRRIEFREALPKTPTGKIMRRALRDRG